MGWARLATRKKAGMDSTSPSPSTARRAAWLPLPILAGLFVAAAAVLLIAGLFLRSTHQLSQTSAQVAHTLDVINEVDHLLSLVKDAETGQRGYLLTHEAHFLSPYEEARLHIGPSLERLRSLTSDNPHQQRRLVRLESLLQRKLAVMERTIMLVRGGQTSAAHEAVRSGEGQRLMDELRALQRELSDEEQQLLKERGAQRERAARSTDAIVLAGSGFLLAFIGFSTLTFVRYFRARAKEEAEREESLAREQAARERAQEERQRESEERFRVLTEMVPQLIWRTRADGNTEYFNPRWYEYTGQTPEQALGAGWTRCLHPDDLERAKENWRRAVATGEPYVIEYRLRRGSDGAYRWFIARGLPLRDVRGYIEGWFGTCTDIDDQKRGAETLHFLSEASAVLAASLDHAATLQQVVRLAIPSLADWCYVDLVSEDGRVERVEVAHADPTLTGLAARVRDVVAGENPGHPPTKALRSGRTVLISQFTPELEEGAARDAEHLRTIRELRVRSLLSAPLLARGRTLGVLTFLTTEASGRQYGEADVLLVEEVARRAAMAIDNARLFSLAQAERQRAEEANRLKDDFLATVSHELRTPLTAMLGWMKMLRTGRLPADKHEKALETVDRNAQVQAQLVEDLLDVSRIMSGKLRLEPRPVHLADVIQAAMESVRPAADAKDIRLEPELTARGDDLVTGDPGRLQQVVWNLLSNAVKFSPAGSRVRVLLRRVEGSVEVAVVDEGPGIPADFLPHVFERFRQLESGTTRRYGGLGLGLAIVRHLVEQHGGTVHVASEGPGRGATFTVRLPPAQPRAAQADTAAPRKSASFPVIREPAPPTLARRRILVVDDEEDNREVMKALLEESGAHVVTAASAAEALQRLREARPELLISDIGMPGEDGYGLITRVRALPAAEGGGVPAVALTAYARVEDRTRALTAGFDMHVAKPVEPAELLSLLTHLIATSPAA